MTLMTLYMLILCIACSSMGERMHACGRVLEHQSVIRIKS